MTDIPIPHSRARIDMTHHPLSRQLNEIHLGAERFILFFKSHPIAAYSGNVIYFHCDPGAEQAAVNKWNPRNKINVMYVRCEAEQFDFIVGQILTTAGLPLTRRES